MARHQMHSDIIGRTKLEELFCSAVASFFREEGQHILSGVSERSLCCRLALYLNPLLPKHGLDDYYVDVEYNREQNGQVKTIIDNDFHVLDITCDLIVHSRGENIARDNLIAIEMKKSSRPQSEKQKDRERLIALTKKAFDGVWSNDGTTNPEHVCGYVMGVYMEVNLNSQRCLFELYENGQKYSEWNKTICE